MKILRKDAINNENEEDDFLDNEKELNDFIFGDDENENDEISTSNEEESNLGKMFKIISHPYIQRRNYDQIGFVAGCLMCNRKDIISKLFFPNTLLEEQEQRRKITTNDHEIRNVQEEKEEKEAEDGRKHDLMNFDNEFQIFENFL